MSARPEKPRDAQSAVALHVIAGGRRVALPIDAVAAVDAPGPVVGVPFGAPWLRGLMPYRGRLLTLMDGGLLFGDRPTAGARVVVLRNLGVEAALAVDVVAEVGSPDAEAGATGSVTSFDLAGLRSHPAFRAGAATVCPAAETSPC